MQIKHTLLAWCVMPWVATFRCGVCRAAFDQHEDGNTVCLRVWKINENGQTPMGPTKKTNTKFLFDDPKKNDPTASPRERAQRKLFAKSVNARFLHK